LFEIFFFIAYKDAVKKTYSELPGDKNNVEPHNVPAPCEYTDFGFLASAMPQLRSKYEEEYFNILKGTSMLLCFFQWGFVGTI
jgi:hypothetical protein